MTNILITGGAGYIGSTLTRMLLNSGYKVRVVDSLRFGGESLVDLLSNTNFEFIKGDLRSSDTCKSAVDGIDVVVHLAAIVGDPACSKEPELATETNLIASKQLYNIAEQFGCSRFIFASTCSNYGKMKITNELLNEESPLAPVSLYAETKVAMEQFLLNTLLSNRCKPVCLRFSTVYGLSPRIRFDLTVNEFAKDAALSRELVIYGEHFWRPYAHVVDLSRSVLMALKAPEDVIAHNVFNVGDTSENYQKKMIAEIIQQQIPDVQIRYIHKNEDPRDYKVSFDKIHNLLGFSASIKVADGIEQIIKSIRQGMIKDPDASKYFNA